MGPSQVVLLRCQHFCAVVPTLYFSTRLGFCSQQSQPQSSPAYPLSCPASLTQKDLSGDKPELAALLMHKAKGKGLADDPPVFHTPSSKYRYSPTGTQVSVHRALAPRAESAVLSSGKGVRIPFSGDERAKINVSEVWRTPGHQLRMETRPSRALGRTEGSQAGPRGSPTDSE